MPKLFDKFTTDSNIGTGLGLYISKNIVEAHGVKIWAYNNNNEMGSTFVFSLPRAVDSESELISKAPAYTVVDNLSASRLKIPEVNIRFYAQIQTMSLPKFFRLNIALKDCYQKHNHN